MEFSICVKVRYLLLLGMGLVCKLGLSIIVRTFVSRKRDKRGK